MRAYVHDPQAPMASFTLSFFNMIVSGPKPILGSNKA